MKPKYWILSLLVILPLLMIACEKDTGVQPTKSKNLNDYKFDPELIPTIPPLDNPYDMNPQTGKP